MAPSPANQRREIGRSWASTPDARAAALRCLELTRGEIEERMLDRIRAISDGAGLADPAYVAGLRDAVSGAIDYAVCVIEHGERHAPQPPPVLRAQARMAARSGVGLDIVLRRYLAGYTLLGELLSGGEVETSEPPRPRNLRHLVPGAPAVLDRLFAVVSDEYSREVQSQIHSTERRRAQRVEGLLAGEPLDSSDLGYDLSAHHVGLVAAGEGASEAVRNLARRAEMPLLVVRGDEQTAWAWLGSSRPTDTADICSLADSVPHPRISIGFGESAEGLRGWRITHRQASAALTVALRASESLARYGEVALLASALHDGLLAASLHDLYIVPLHLEGDKGEAIKKTALTYLTTERNVSSTAALLGVDRRTVTSRLRTLEERIGRPLTSCTAQLECALRLENLSRPHLQAER